MTTPRRVAGFTIVEMLVVVSIIAVLAGLLLPALGGARRRAKKMDETNRIRQVGIAWNLYSQSNNDAALPGFLEAGDGAPGSSVQGPLGWNVRYKFPVKIDTAPAPGIVREEDAEEWPWRLLPYLSYDQDAMLGYLGLQQQSSFTQWEMSNYDVVDRAHVYPGNWTYQPFPPDLPRPSRIAAEPMFGYNALYVGGWWEMFDVGGQDPEYLARPRFADAKTIADAGGPSRRTSVVARSPSVIREPASFVVFCSSSMLIPGEYEKFEDTWPGCHYVVPPIVAETSYWDRTALTGGETITVEEETYDVMPWGTVVPDVTPVPIGRYTGRVSVLYGDLHTEPTRASELADQRKWINTADGRRFKHTE